MLTAEFSARMAALDIFPVGGSHSQKLRQRAYEIILEALRNQKADDNKKFLDWFNNYEDDEAIRKMASEDLANYLESEETK